jgi:glycolate dehydrogenase FAD-binding subunit
MTTPALWLAALQALVSAEQCETESTRLQDYAVDGLIPKVAVYPETAAQVATVLQWAQAAKLAVVPRGSGTAIALGGVARRLDIMLSTSRLTQVSDYDVANFTITAGAGTTGSQIAELTTANRQMLPVQYPWSAATLGGLIATNAYTPKRLLYGGVRDLLLGLRVTLPSGEIAHFGGKVVKNVAGYDMCKLFIGSLGVLGVIVEATFKLYALPERDDTLMAALPSLAQGAAAVVELTATQLLPSQILLLNPAAAGTLVPLCAVDAAAGAALLLVNCEGMDEAVERQLTDIARICQGHGASVVKILSGDAQLQLRGRLCSGSAHVAAPAGSPSAQPTSGAAQRLDGTVLRVRLGIPPSQVHRMMEATAQTLRRIAPGVSIIGDCGVGLVTLGLDSDGLDVGAIEGELLPALRHVRSLVTELGGYAVIESAPPTVKSLLEVWGPTPSSFALLKALKQRFDPNDILSPGRFIGGL